MDAFALSQLNNAANYYAFSQSIKSKGTANIIFGLLSIVFGAIYSLVMSPINVLLVFIGLFLLGVGIWAKMSQTLNSLLFAGIALLVLGGWNIVVFFLNVVTFISAAAQGESTTAVGFLGIVWGGVQIAFGVDALTRYRRYSSNPVIRPDRPTLENVDAMIKPILSANIKNESDVIQFVVQGGYSGYVWQGKLARPYTVLASRGGADIHIVRPEEVEITTSGRFRMTNRQKAVFKIRDLTYKGTIDQLSLERYSNWKKAAPSQ